MRASQLIVTTLLSLLLGASPVFAAGKTDTGKDPLAAAIANPARSDKDRERDQRDHPESVLKLAGFGPGMTIADVFGGGGYYAEILSRLVGPEGHVVLVNNPPYDAFAKKGLTPRLADQRLPNVDYRIAPTEALGLGEGALDGALIIMTYHDLYHVNAKEGWPAIDAAQFLDQIAKAMKPGARLLIVDHAARSGSGKADAQDLHRIDEAFAKADFAAHGFEFVASSDVLRNKDDDHAKNVFDPSVQGKTDRFVHVYRKR